MAITVNWMQAAEGDPEIEYSAQQFRQLIEAMYSEGVRFRTGNELIVTQRAAGANLSVDVAPGQAIVYGDDQSDQGAYLVEVTDAVTNVPWPAPPGSNSRIDLLVLQVNDPQAGGGAGYNAEPVVVEGVAASSPVAPAVPDSAVELARVSVAAGQTSILAINITDRRPPAQPATGVEWPGVIHPFAGALAPDGFLLCDGSVYSVSVYRRLYDTIGSVYNTGGEPAGQFRVPDLRGRVPVGRHSGQAPFDTLGETGGAATATLTEAELPTHDHAVTVDWNGTHTHAEYGDGGAVFVNGGGVTAALTGVAQTGTTGAAGLHNHTASSANAGDGDPFSVLQPYAVLNYIIKT